MHEKKEIWYKISFIFQFSNHNFIIWYQFEQKYMFWLTFLSPQAKAWNKEIEIFLKEEGHFKHLLKIEDRRQRAAEN